MISWRNDFYTSTCPEVTIARHARHARRLAKISEALRRDLEASVFYDDDYVALSWEATPR
jgi:hypothetical protein